MNERKAADVVIGEGTAYRFLCDKGTAITSKMWIGLSREKQKHKEEQGEFRHVLFSTERIITVFSDFYAPLSASTKRAIQPSVVRLFTNGYSLFSPFSTTGRGVSSIAEHSGIFE